MGRRDEVLEAALGVLVDRGGRGFTHRAIDRAAGVPEGTTSNFFPNRHRLLVGVAEQLMSAAADPRKRMGRLPTSEQELVHLLATLLRHALGPHRLQSVGHSILSFEAVSDPDLQELLEPAFTAWRGLFHDMLVAAGVPDPEFNCRLVGTYFRALLLGQHVSPDPHFDAEASIRLFVSGLLHDGDDPDSGVAVRGRPA